MYQFYAQDTFASVANDSVGEFLTFGVDPDAEARKDPKAYHTFNADHRNFVWYHTLGNVGFLGYSGVGCE